MGIHEGRRIWRTGAEEVVVRGQENDLNLSDLVNRSRVQAEKFASENPNPATVFIGAGHRDSILDAKDKIRTARKIAYDNPHFIPDIVEGDDDRAAFLVALAEELDKPEYNQ